MSWGDERAGRFHVLIIVFLMAAWYRQVNYHVFGDERAGRFHVLIIVFLIVCWQRIY